MGGACARAAVRWGAFVAMQAATLARRFVELQRCWVAPLTFADGPKRGDREVRAASSSCRPWSSAISSSFGTSPWPVPHSWRRRLRGRLDPRRCVPQHDVASVNVQPGGPLAQRVLHRVDGVLTQQKNVAFAERMIVALFDPPPEHRKTRFCSSPVYTPTTAHIRCSCAALLNAGSH